ncbi:hypothetical protein BpHYR1_024475 [Brachionus plicatilis]|uniref:Uncharacterized protein n=1 Tax=Brachionus plicatilis TaxID=10195 RepID=A0A3M7Q6K4_BRAPC|nr:hypothetical protein BpHYR1_024475 [Brachionus plicatilis]
MFVFDYLYSNNCILPAFLVKNLNNQKRFRHYLIRRCFPNLVNGHKFNGDKFTGTNYFGDITVKTRNWALPEMPMANNKLLEKN